MWSISSLDTCNNGLVGLTCNSDTCHVDDNDHQDAPVDWTCNLSSSYAQTFSILITSNWSFLDDEAEGFQTSISYAFAFIVGILLLNILIAIINNAFSAIERSGDLEYWKYRLNFENGTQQLYTVALGFVRPINDIRTDGVGSLWKKEIERSIEKENSIRAPERSLLRKSMSMRDYFFTAYSPEETSKDFAPRIFFNVCSSEHFNKLEKNDKIDFFNWWFDRNPVAKVPALKDRLWYYFNRASSEEIVYPGQSFENVVQGIKYNKLGSGIMFIFARILSYILIIINTTVILGIFLLGLVTFGFGWPSKMRERLFFGPIQNRNDDISKLKSKIERKFLVAQEEVNDVKASIGRISKNQEELMKTMLANQAQVSELIALLKSQDI